MQMELERLEGEILPTWMAATKSRIVHTNYFLISENFDWQLSSNCECLFTEQRVTIRNINANLLIDLIYCTSRLILMYNEANYDQHF
jgi:hypothetical protein